MMTRSDSNPMDSALVSAVLDHAILTLTINRPAVYNVIDAATSAALARHLDAARDDAAVRAIIITGAGPKAFCAGFDLQYAEQHPEVYTTPLFGSEIVRRPPGDKPLLAAVNGIAMGLGFELALACDLIIASASATFALPEPKVGLAAMGGGVARLTRTIGSKRALGIALTARTVTAAEGLSLGFVTALAEGDVLVAATAWARQICSGGPLSIAATQEIAAMAVELPLAQALDPRSYPAVMRVLDSADAVEGRRAFLQRRPPQWQNA